MRRSAEAFSHARNRNMVICGKEVSLPRGGGTFSEPHKKSLERGMNSTVGSGENRFLNTLKGAACLLVVCIHCRFPGAFGELVQAQARVAVPFFFVVSGIFLPGKDPSPAQIRSRTGRALRRLLPQTALVWTVYTVYSFVWQALHGMSVTQLLQEKIAPQEIKVFLLFQSGRLVWDPAYGFDHMWYLFALITVLAFLWAFAPILRKIRVPVCVILLSGLYFGMLLQVVYPIRPFGISIRTWYVCRNWLLMGIPFVLLGHILSQEEIPDHGGKTDRIAAAAAAGGALLTALEYARFGIKEIYAGTLFTLIGLTVLALRHPLREVRLLRRIGKEGSAQIYYWHVLVLSLVDWAIALIPGMQEFVWTSVPFAWCKPILIMALSILAAAVIGAAKQSQLKKKENQKENPFG